VYILTQPQCGIIKADVRYKQVMRSYRFDRSSGFISRFKSISRNQKQNGRWLF